MNGVGSSHRSAAEESAESAELVGIRRRALVLDLDSRHSPPETPSRAIHRAVSEYAAPETLLLAKIDSLLRGNVAATVAALHCARYAPETTAVTSTSNGAPTTVLAPALPAGGRTVVGGVVHVGGVPLHEGGFWSAEVETPPVSATAALAPVPVRNVPLAVVRSGLDQLRAEFAAAAEAGKVSICDAATDADLDAVVAAAMDLPGIRLAGSGGLAAALGRAFSGSNPVECPNHTPPAQESAAAERALLIVVGTADAAATRQVRRLRTAGIRSITLDAFGLGRQGVRCEDIERIAAAMDEGPVVVSLSSSEALDPTWSRAIAGQLAATVHRAALHRAVTEGHTAGPDSAERTVDLVLTGGETARRVLDAFGVRSLVPVAEVHRGAVHSRTSDGRSVVTRPGSFGAPDSLIRIVEHLRPLTRVPPAPEICEPDPSEGPPPLAAGPTEGYS